MVDNLSGGLGDLNEDVLGGQVGHLNTGGESISFESTGMDGILSSWAEGANNQISSIHNSQYCSGMQEQKRGSDDINKQKGEAYRVARWMIMNNEPDQRLRQHFEKAIGESLMSHAEAKILLAERPLLGQLYLDRNIAGKCVEIRKAGQNAAARHALFVVMAPECEVCSKHYAGICPETGRRLIAHIPATKAELMESSQHLMERGRILSDARINDWNDLKAAMSSEKEKSEIRIYPHAQPVVRGTPGLNIRNAHDLLARQAQSHQEEFSDVNQEIDNRTVLPIARFMAEELQKRTSAEILKRETDRQFPDEELKRKAIRLLGKIADPSLLYANLVAYTELYGGNCRQCFEFMRELNIKVAYVAPTEKCLNGCRFRDNIAGSCSLLGAKIFDGKISQEEAATAIDEMKCRGMIDENDVKKVKRLGFADTMRALKTAVQICLIEEHKPGLQPAETRNEMNSLIGSAGSFADRENAVLAARQLLSGGMTVSRAKKKILATRSDADGIVNDALAGMEKVGADLMDDCLERKYQLSSTTILAKGKKCEGCEHADAIGCNRHRRKFATSTGSLTGDGCEQKEANEIMSYFADSQLVADVDPRVSKTTLDIQFDNPGADMIVDLGKAACAKPEECDFGSFFNGAELVIDPNPPERGRAPLQIEGLGSAEGFDLSSIL